MRALVCLLLFAGAAAGQEAGDIYRLSWNDADRSLYRLSVQAGLRARELHLDELNATGEAWHCYIYRRDGRWLVCWVQDGITLHRGHIEVSGDVMTGKTHEGTPFKFRLMQGYR